MTLEAYLSGEETNRPHELVFGVLREPAAPTFAHQIVLGQLYVRLEHHVRRQALGRVALSPIDVILDRERALVVQPDLLFVSAARLDICNNQVWGAPDLVAEILSTANRRHDRVVKAGWYRRYGVREYWLVDPISCSVEIVDFADPDDAEHPPKGTGRVFEESARIRSRVLPRLRLRAADLFLP